MHDPSLANMSSVLSAACFFGVKVTLTPCLLRAKLFSNIYSTIIAPLQLTALESSHVWFSRVRLKLLCGSSLNNLGTRSYLFPLKLESPQSLRNLLRNIQILLQLPLRASSTPLILFYRAAILLFLTAWTAI